MIADRYPKLGNLFICQKHFPPAAPVDEEWVSVLADSLASGSSQQEPIGAQVCACNNGRMAVTYHYHTYLAMDKTYKPDQIARVTQTDYKNREEHILGQARNQNQRDLSMEKFFEAFIEPLLEKGWTQARVARAVGKPPSYISMAGNPAKYGPKAQAEARAEIVQSLNTHAQKSSSSRDDISPTLASKSEGRALHKAPATSPMITLDARPGAGRDSPREGAPAPTLSARIKEKRAECESIRSTLTRKSEIAKALVGEYRTLAWNLLDYCDSQDSGRWSGEVPVPKQRRGTLLRAKVMVDGKPYEVPFIDETASGWHVLYLEKITFIRARDCVAILDAGKVSA
jgi:hypothetical protein